MTMFGLLQKRQLLDDDSVQWLFASFAWALRNFDAGVFYNETILVIPSNEFFPGRENSVHGMADLIFEQVKSYAGMQHWPTLLLDHNSCLIEPPRVEISGALRGAKGVIRKSVDDANRLPITYNPDQVLNPEALIATYSHQLAYQLGLLAKEPPPGGEQNLPHVTEVLAVFMGFGLMFANSAFTFQTGGCGSCKRPGADRSSYLSQYDTTYALALFSVLKEIPNREVLAHLKKSLRPFYKKAVREIRARKQDHLQLPGI
ncbi:MAG: hypothetical protein ABFR19_06190 [Pseudomonadota bacterium]